MPPETRYARSGDVHIAYQVFGDGPVDVVLIPGFLSNVELGWTVPMIAEFMTNLASLGRIITFDKRGTGMSDRVIGAPTLEVRVDDVRAVMDAAGSSSAAIFGISEGGPMSMLFAASHPERAWALVLFGSFAREAWAPDYVWGVTDEEYLAEARVGEPQWGSFEYSVQVARDLAPDAGEENHRALAGLIRQSASPGAVAALEAMNRQIDVRSVLGAIRVPTLVMNWERDSDFILRSSTDLAERIPAARHVVLPGTGHAPFSSDSSQLIDETRRFLTEAWNDRETQAHEPERVLATVLFTDIVDATARAAELGDREWRTVLARHHELVRRQLVRYRGNEIDTAGDGFFASFDGPARALRCAHAVAAGVRDLGLEVRAGLHAGECEVIDGKIGGIAVHTGARVAARAQPGEVLVSGTVRDLVAGSGLEFDDRGAAQLKGLPGEVRLFALRE